MLTEFVHRWHGMHLLLQALKNDEHPCFSAPDSDYFCSTKTHIPEDEVKESCNKNNE